MDFNRSSPVLQASRPLGNPQLLNSSWLESSIKETLLPGKPWHKVLDRIGAVFADEVKQQLQEPKKRQMIFQFLGPQFVQKYFSEYPNQPSLLFSENISLTDYHQLEQSTLNMLQGQCSKAAQLVRFQLRQDGDFADLSPEMVDFVNDTCSLIEANMELLLATSEEQQKDEESAREQDSSAWFSSWALLARRRPHSIESQDIHLAIRRQTAIQSYAKGKDKPNQEPRARPLNCLGSDVLGESVCSIVLSNPEYLQTICDRLSGKLLPKRLRQLVWINKILKSDKRSHTKDSHKNIEKVAREKFGRTVQHRLAELKLRSATRSPISGLIENAVVEKYENTPCMQPFATSEPMILETSKALNILYVYNGHYEPNFIHWLFPLQVALKRTPTAAEHPYELAMYLNLLMQNLFPSWPEILAMAERVMSLLEREDPEFFTQLQSSFQKNVTYDPKDFLVELITLERKEAKNLYASSDALQHPPLLNKELLASPVIFLRKWMGEGFVSILDLPAILLIWDQMYMQNWNRKVMEDFCLAVLMLLKPSLMEAEDYSALRQVFLFHGYHLLTADIQRAWIHLQQGGLPADIPYFNRLRSPREEPPRRRVEKVPVAFREILPVGVKDVVLTLILPTLFVKLSLADMWLKDFDPLAVKLTVSVYFDQMKLRTKTSSAKPVLLQTTKGKVADIETSELSLQFTDVWTFDPLDPSEFTDAAESGADGIPFIVLRILYNRTENDSLTLGWVKVNAFQQDPAGVLGLWLPREYSLHLPVQPGTEPVNMIAPTTEQPTKESSYGPLHVKFTVYDPLKENLVESKILALEQTTRDSGVPPRLREAWVPHSEATVLPEPTALDHAFDLYIDGLRYIPDSATIIKVTGKIVNSGLGDIPDLVAFPSLTSPARNPEFQYRAVLNTNDQKAMIASACLLLQVFTVVQYSGIITVLGNCGLHIFNDNGKLNVGGFQLRLRTETPPSLAPSEFSKYWSVPCCSILVRLLPHTQDPVPEPKYPTGFYFSDEAKPTKSELQIISSFQKDERFPRRVEDMTRRLMDRAQSRAESDQVESWYKERLDIQKFPVPKRLLTYIDLHHIVRYHQEAGVRARVTQAFGLQVEGLYVNAFARILKGRESMDLPELPQGWGGEEKFLMRQHDYASLQTSPRWTDPSVAMHPYLDAHSVLLVQLFGMDAIYKPDPTGQRPGVVAPRAGQNLQLYSQSQLGWTAVPLFQGQYVKSGIHSAPLFQGVPNTDFLEAVNSRPLMDVITDGIKKKTLNLLKTDGSITVEVWDSHYFDDEHYILEDIHDLLAAGKVSKFLCTQSKKKGNELSQLVLQTMDKKLQKLKRNSPEYQQEERFFEEAMTSAFYHLIETALLNSGYSPL